MATTTKSKMFQPQRHCPLRRRCPAYRKRPDTCTHRKQRPRQLSVRPSARATTRLPEAAAPKGVHVDQQFEEEHRVEEGLKAIEEAWIPHRPVTSRVERLRTRFLELESHL